MQIAFLPLATLLVLLGLPLAAQALPSCSDCPQLVSGGLAAAVSPPEVATPRSFSFETRRQSNQRRFLARQTLIQSALSAPATPTAGSAPNLGGGAGAGGGTSTSGAGATVPEPNTGILMALGLAGIGLFRGRGRAR